MTKVSKLCYSPFGVGKVKSNNKILILAQEIYPQICVGGLGKFVAGIKQGLIENGWEVVVFGPQKRKPIYLPYWSSKCQQRANQIVRRSARWCLKKSWLPSWVWVQDWEGIYQAEVWKSLTASWQRKAKIIWTIHSPVSLKGSQNYGYSDKKSKDDPINWGDDFFDFAGFVEKGLAAADLVTTVSLNFAKEICRLPFFEKSEKILGIGNGVDKKDWDPYKDKLLGYHLKSNWPVFKKINKRIMQSIFGLPQKEVPVFAFVSRLVPQKGIDLLTRTLPKFLAKNEVQLVIVGQGLKKYQDLLTAIKSEFPAKVGLCLQSNFSLPHQIFAGSDFLILPSLSEPFGIVVAESRNYGVVPIVRKVGGLSDQVKDNINGLSFENNFHHLLLDKLYQALQLWQTDYWWRLSINGRNLTESWDKITRKYDQYLFEANQKRLSSARWSEKKVLFS